MNKKLNIAAWVMLVVYFVLAIVLACRIETLEKAEPVNAGAMYYSSIPQIIHEDFYANIEWDKKLFDKEMYNTGNIDFDGHCFTPHDPGVYMVTVQNVQLHRVTYVAQFVDLATAWVVIEDTEGNTWNEMRQPIHEIRPEFIYKFSLFGIRQIDEGESVCVLISQWGNPTMHMREFAKFGIERIR